jgi:hypothetical protein
MRKIEARGRGVDAGIFCSQSRSKNLVLLKRMSEGISSVLHHTIVFLIFF